MSDRQEGAIPQLFKEDVNVRRNLVILAASVAGTALAFATNSWAPAIVAVVLGVGLAIKLPQEDSDD